MRVFLDEFSKLFRRRQLLRRRQRFSHRFSYGLLHRLRFVLHAFNVLRSCPARQCPAGSKRLSGAVATFGNGFVFS
jgi:hypothetical protein